ncbi:MAG: hypothetical protein ACI9EF_003877 [Pseudohongiellaceae bacterium]|jgi:uncharacterized protein YecE (DUF72 family)
MQCSRADLLSGRFHMGCAVWGHGGWLGPVYPERTSQRAQLGEYCRRFTAVEGNALFYGMPSPATVERWATTMPEGFLLLPKLPRTLSHDAPLAEGLQQRDRWLERLAVLGNRLGPAFLQLPPSYGPERRDDLLAFLADWPSTAPRLCVELRHLGWFDGAVAQPLFSELAQLNVGRVILDTRPLFAFGDNPQSGNPRKKPRLPVPTLPPAQHVMLRFVGHPDRQRNEPWLLRWAELIEGWLTEGRDVFVFCHCPVEDHSPFLVRRLQQLLEQRGAPVPALPWDSLDEPRQADLF